MKIRISAIVFGVLCFLTAGAAIATNFIGYAMGPENGLSFEFIKNVFQEIFSNLDTLGNHLKDYVPFLSIIGVGAIFAIIWLIVDIVRRRLEIIWAFPLMLAGSVMLAIYYYGYVLPILHYFDFSVPPVNPFTDMPIILFITACLSFVGYFMLLLAFIVDMATGKRKKLPAPRAAKEKAPAAVTPVEEAPAKEEVKEETKEEAVYAEEIIMVEDETEEEPVDESLIAAEPKEAKKKPNPAKKAPAKKAPAKKAAKPAAKKAPAKKAAPEEAPVEEAKEAKPAMVENEDGTAYPKAYHVSRRAELNKWQVKATGSDKALKLFNTQKEAIAYADELAKSQNASVRVHSKSGKIRKI